MIVLPRESLVILGPLQSEGPSGRKLRPMLNREDNRRPLLEGFSEMPSMHPAHRRTRAIDLAAALGRSPSPHARRRRQDGDYRHSDHHPSDRESHSASSGAARANDER